MGLTQISKESLPTAWQRLTDQLSSPGDVTYIFFTCDDDALTGKPWCPDVRAATPVVEKASAGSEVVAVSVGSRDQWKDRENVFRIGWELPAIPVLAKYTRTDEGIRRDWLVCDEAKIESDVTRLLGA